jgi:hypothetical protein
VDQEFRDDGTVICPVHGLRYDPNLTSGCIRCPRTQPPPKRPVASKGSSPPRAPSEPPPRGFEVARIGGRISTPPIPFEPGAIAGVNDPNLKIVAAPPMKYSRRGLYLGLGALVLGGVAAGAWFLRPEGPTSWPKKVKPLAWSSPLGNRTGSFYACTKSQTQPCPLLVLIDPERSSSSVVARFARHAERHGWIVASTDAIGRGVTTEDGAEVGALVDYLRSTMNVDATKAMLSGYEAAGEVAYRLAVLEPEHFGGAIAESCGIRTWRDVGGFAKSGTPIFLFTRANDPGRDAMLTMKDEMERKGIRVTLEEGAGRHESMSGEELEPAFLWLDSVHTS